MRNAVQPCLVRRTNDPSDLLIDAAGSPLLARLYAGRGVTEPGDLDYALARLPHYGELPDIEYAAALLAGAIADSHPIRVVGDFDADGATSTALAVSILRALGARNVDYCIPERIRQGRGLSPSIVSELDEPAANGVIVTVDNGMDSFDGVDAARAAGWQVVIADHHLPGEALPNADAVVNPNCAPAHPKLGDLAGVGVTFYLMLAARAHVASKSDAGPTPRLSDALDLVAIGTVADRMRMTYVNRLLVSQGLRRMRSASRRPGVAALLAHTTRDSGQACVADIGFGVAPALNAAGRLGRMTVAVACLLADTLDGACRAADELATMNTKRRAMQREMQAEADRLATARLAGAPDRSAPVVVVHHHDWHEGLTGLVAGRLCECYQKPAVVFTTVADGRLKGSARSLTGLSIRDALAAVDAAQPNLIERFGGHAGAAGLTLAPNALDIFEHALSSAIDATWDATTPPTWHTDGELAGDQFTLEIARMLARAGPWGPTFEPPLFDGLFKIDDARVVGSRHLKLRVWPVVGGESVDAICFGQGDRVVGAGSCWRLVYRLSVNVFNGRSTVQLEVAEMWPSEAED